MTFCHHVKQGRREENSQRSLHTPRDVMSEMYSEVRIFNSNPGSSATHGHKERERERRYATFESMKNKEVLQHSQKTHELN